MAFSFVRLLAVSLLALPAIVSAAPSDTTTGPFNPTGITPNPVSRGLGPKPPVRRAHRAVYPRQSNTPPPPPSAPFPTGSITVTMGSTSGFISAVPNSFGEYSFTTDSTQALQVELHNTDGSSSFDIKALNGLTTYPFLTAITGFADTSSDLGPGSFNYCYIGGSSQTPAHAPPTTQSNSFSDASGSPEQVESAIWTLGADGSLVPEWVNTDGSTPAATLIYVPGAAGFALTGDVDAFTANFGGASVASFSFTSA
ncbi:hypothetical protein EUX98_g6277 [Antrodiella citrinella]|uniref:Uncharacterized protein n=1 Tax=Antrodiella citrinella TaxID=2447956 RepID=A0A4S4MPN9_9APHY|nr:hypothetical protein EUX98_g6277 [Antrodiella citrinella]